MDADTKRGAVISAIRERGFDECDADIVLEALAAQGLHVVTAAEKAVLDACADCQLRYLRLHAEDGMGSAWVAGVAEAELARREAAK